jgi:hypothetical protein
VGDPEAGYWHEVEDDEAEALLEAGLVDVDDEGDLILAAEFNDGEEGLEDGNGYSPEEWDQMAEDRLGEMRALHDGASGQQQLEALRREVANLREEDAASQGYQAARDEDAELEADQEDALEEVEDAMELLASNLERPVSVSEAEDVLSQLPENANLQDPETLIEAGRRAGVHRFTSADPSDTRSNIEAKGAREAYINERTAEQESEPRPRSPRTN